MDNINEFYDFSTKLLAALLPLGLIGFIYLRIGSIHIFLQRIWNLFFTFKSNSPNIIDEFNQEYIEIAKFRFMHNISVKQQTDIYKIITWMKKNKIPPYDLTYIKRWLNINENIELLKPTKQFLIIRAFLFFTFTITAFVGNALITLDNMIIQVINSSNYYIINYDQYSDIWRNNIVELDQCKTPQNSDDDFKVLCDFSNSSTFSETIQKNIRTQIITGSFILFVSLYLVFIFSISIRSYNITNNLIKNLNST